ncbi:hypothetical protein P280DRAFT_525356, partial [Massarina eburnea CBS 473.64]
NTDGRRYGCALSASAYDGTEDILESLIKAGGDVNKQGDDYGTSLEAAAWFDDLENVELLLDHDALVNPEPYDEHGYPLQAATGIGYGDIIRLLLEHGAHVDTCGGKYGYAIM